MTIEMECAPLRRRFVNDYQTLRQYFLSIANVRVAPSDLVALKEIFADKIRSTRVTEYIHDVEGLLRILEKRNALAYDNVEPLKLIATTCLEDPELVRTLCEYEARNRSRPLLPRFNVYDIPGGKYSRGDSESRIPTASNSSLAPRANCPERVNENSANSRCNNSEEPGTIECSAVNRSDDNETEFFIEINAPTAPKDRSDVANDDFVCAKVRERVCSRFGGRAMGAFFGVGLIIVVIAISNLIFVTSSASAPQFESQPGVSGLPTNSGRAEENGREILAQMTLYTTQRAFPETLLGSIFFGSTRNKTEHDSQVVTTVLLEISEKVGRYWRDVARYLDVKEYDIDEIDHTPNLQLKDKAYKAFQIFQKKCNSSEWRMRLKKALEKARRRDLMELVDELSENR